MINDTFCRLPFVSAQCFIGTQKYYDAGILLSYDDDDYGESYAQIKAVLRALTKNDFLQPYISDDDFRCSNARGDIIGYNLYVSDVRYQQNFTASQPIKIEIKFDGVVALVLTNKLVSISSDGQRHFHLI